MDKALNHYLREQERVLWQGKTETFPLLDTETKFKTLRNWILTVALASGLLAVYCANNGKISMGFVGMVLLVAVIILISPLMERRSLMGQKYWITDQRAIMMSRDKTFYYMELEEIDNFQLISGKAAQDCLVLGGCLFEEVNKQLRWRACHPKIDLQGHGPQDNVMGLIFYCVSNAEGAVTILRNRSHARAA